MIKTSIREMEAVIDAWKAENGITGTDYVPANSGSRRTESKRALLRAIEEIARRQGLKPPFKANY